MNKRIRELAEQAEWRFADNATGEFSEYDKRLLKFAELIVEKCANVADENYIHRGSRTCGLAIRLHFGVEE